VLLFIDHLPLHRWTDSTRTPPQEHWSVVLPTFITERGLSQPPAATPIQGWLFDSGNTGEAFAWRQHLLTLGLDPDVRRGTGQMRIKSSVGKEILVPIREADFWLCSNVPALQGVPFPIRLEFGIPFRDVPSIPDPQFQRPMFGVRAVRRAGLRVELDFSQDTVSIWVPTLAGLTP
jgi:hypothetical protein